MIVLLITAIINLSVSCVIGDNFADPKKPVAVVKGLQKSKESSDDSSDDDSVSCEEDAPQPRTTVPTAGNT